MLEDTGELVVFDATGEPVYTSDTAGFPDAQMAIEPGGLSLVDDDATRVWTSQQGLVVE